MTMTEPIPCTAIVFDFDGTLADSMPFLERIGVSTMMKYYGIKREEATRRYRTTTGLPYEQQIKINFPDNNKNEDAIAEFEKLKIDRIFEQRLFPDTVRTLAIIQERGFAVFVSSSTFQSTIEEYFTRRNLQNYFDGIMGYRPGFEKGKDHFEYVRNHYGIDLSKTVFVGDSIKDYERANGICSFIALEGMFKEQEFRQAGHEGPVIDELSDVPDIVAYTE
ncbi:HAD family hydrolase [Candidatus Thorarchaeota archaeon]|nr:MAG: HAD family hydrolase [Candidatus Thorarchaeota archaeon]